MKKAISSLLALGLCAALLAGCGTQSDAPAQNGGSSASGPITVISREDGSGTRGAFIELFGVEEKDEAGGRVDHTTEDAEIVNSTEVMIQSVAGNSSAIGYISLGSLDATVKALKIDGAEATAETIQSGAYKVSRPFNVAVKSGSQNELAQDFLAYIVSREGQTVVSETGYIGDGSAGAYAGGKPSGKITVAGSSSVAPLMEKLAEAYQTLNTGAQIELQTSDSTTGMTNTIDGVCDLGMASRELRQEELDAGLTNTVIATDGIAVIVNGDSPIDNLTGGQVRAIYTGETADWSELA